jgi:poly(A) polymerase
MLDAHALRDATFEIVSRQQGRVSIPKRFAQGMSDILMLQARFPHCQGRHATRLYEHPRFRAAWDFLQLRSEAGECGIDEETVAWWREIQALEPEEAHARLTASTRPGAGAKRKKRRRRGGRGRSRARVAGDSTPAGGGASPDSPGER